MATLKKKNVEETPAETVDTPEEKSYINEEEKEVITADGEQYIEDEEKVSSKKMNKVLIFVVLSILFSCVNAK